MMETNENVEMGSLLQDSGMIAWKSPSNIALVKYWGKREHQLPANPSVSMTLSSACTETSLEYSADLPAKGPLVEFYFEGRRDDSFGQRVEKYIRGLVPVLPGLDRLNLTIHSRNTFPHSSGIASSASSMSALALCLTSLYMEKEHHDFFRTASNLARLGSGSASRSVFGGYSLWGKYEGIKGSSDHYAVEVNTGIDPVFLHWHDAILIVNAGKKAVSSSAGHALMRSHHYADGRIQQVNGHLSRLFEAMREGDVELFIRIVENEALSLHGLMLSSDPSYLLMDPGTIRIIHKIRDFREQSGVPVCFTLDAGPNVHLLYPQAVRDQVLALVKEELLEHCEGKRWIDDECGTGPERTV